MTTSWINDNIIEVFGVASGIAYVILEIRRSIFLWPLGIITSAAYIYIFARNGFYANMGLQGYYLVISVYGWYRWNRPVGQDVPEIRRIDRKTGAWCLTSAVALWVLLWFLLDKATGSPVALWDGLIASLSVVATWMLTRKYFELWFVWLAANAIAVVVYLSSQLYPTGLLFLVYFSMSVVGAKEWRRVMTAGSKY
ncbi:MAG TPA: nicotinamide riboside transporter PnuC [Bacteroidales bacterium]|jgi:nicotinamide mononucleotide transporter|nr:hypothetical protein [Bacteroidales bacterium]HNR41646.1 nicotinamide riboside transporter PnuC [Bacteroidales bacterium]HQG77704.1 nicotinamide riboside transporter PnuC [Bacteroidales bacterium]